LTLSEIIGQVNNVQDENLIKTIQWLADNDKIRMDDEGQYKWYPKPE
jgi:hypothetical protein